MLALASDTVAYLSFTGTQTRIWRGPGRVYKGMFAGLRLNNPSGSAAEGSSSGILVARTVPYRRKSETKTVQRVEPRWDVTSTRPTTSLRRIAPLSESELISF